MSLALGKLNAAQSKKLTRLEILKLQPKKNYNDGRTKQSFKDETDINKIMQRAEVSGTISHLSKYEGVYVDFADFDYFENLQKLTRGREIFDELPAEIRNEFSNSPGQFFDYVNNPANVDRLEILLPGLAAPGRQLAKINPPNADEAAVLEADAERIEAVATSTGSETRVVASEGPQGDEKPPSGG